METLESLVARVIAFRDERDWKQFHNPKDMAISLTLESAELLELTQWKNGQELQESMDARRQDVGIDGRDRYRCA